MLVRFDRVIELANGSTPVGAESVQVFDLPVHIKADLAISCGNHIGWRDRGQEGCFCGAKNSGASSPFIDRSGTDVIEIGWQGFVTLISPPAYFNDSVISWSYPTILCKDLYVVLRGGSCNRFYPHITDGSIALSASKYSGSQVEVGTQLTGFGVSGGLEGAPRKESAGNCATCRQGGNNYNYTPIPPFLAVVLALLRMPAMCVGWHRGPALLLIVGWLMVAMGGAGILMILIESL